MTRQLISKLLAVALISALCAGFVGCDNSGTPPPAGGKVREAGDGETVQAPGAGDNSLGQSSK